MSCATKKASFVEVEIKDLNKSVVFFYRPDSMSNIMVSPGVFVDGVKLTEIKNKNYLYKVVSHGEHIFKLGVAVRYTGEQQLTLNLEKGDNIYLRINTTMKFQINKPYSRSFSIEKITKETALLEMQNLVYAGDAEKKMPNTKNSEVVDKNDIKQGQFSTSKTRDPFSKK